MKIGKRMLILMCRECLVQPMDCEGCEIQYECKELFHNDSPIGVAEREHINWKFD